MFSTWQIGIMLVLVAADKISTYLNLKRTEKYHPEIQPASKIEKNPLAKWFFDKTGYVFGSIFYFIISCLTFLLAWYLLGSSLDLITKVSGYEVAFYLISCVYLLVFANNMFFYRRLKTIPGTVETKYIKKNTFTREKKDGTH